MLADACSMRTTRGDDDIYLDVGSVEAQKSGQGAACQVIVVRPAKKDEDTLDRAFPRWHTIVQFSIDRL